MSGRWELECMSLPYSVLRSVYCGIPISLLSARCGGSMLLHIIIYY